jgi:hypothetical protein
VPTFAGVMTMNSARVVCAKLLTELFSFSAPL